MSKTASYFSLAAERPVKSRVSSWRAEHRDVHVVAGDALQLAVRVDVEVLARVELRVARVGAEVEGERTELHAARALRRNGGGRVRREGPSALAAADAEVEAGLLFR